MNKMDANLQLAVILSFDVSDEFFADDLLSPYEIRELKIDKVIRQLDDDAKVIVSWSCYNNDLEQCEHILKMMGEYDDYTLNEKEFEGYAEVMSKKDACFSGYIGFANSIMVM